MGALIWLCGVLLCTLHLTEHERASCFICCVLGMFMFLLTIQKWATIVAPMFVGFCVSSMFCCALLCVLSSFVIISLVFCDCCCSVALPHGAVGWSAVCDCGIF